MRLVRGLYAIAFFALAATSSAQAQVAISGIPSDAKLKAMSSQEFSAFLAGPALSRSNVIKSTAARAASDNAPSCPDVENNGINAAAAPAPQPSLLARLFSALIHR